MKYNIIAAVAALLIGSLIAYLNYRISKSAMHKSAQTVSAMMIVRQIINIAYLVGVYFLSNLAHVSPMYALIGAAVGLTVPMFWFTCKLANHANPSKEGEK